MGVKIRSSNMDAEALKELSDRFSGVLAAKWQWLYRESILVAGRLISQFLPQSGGQQGQQYLVGERAFSTHSRSVALPIPPWISPGPQTPTLTVNFDWLLD